MSKPRRNKGTLNKKDGDGQNQDFDMGQNQELAPTTETLDIGVASNNSSTPTHHQKEKIVIMYPLEKEETKSVKDIVTNFENLPPTHDQPEKNPTTTLDPMAVLLNDLKESLKASNDQNAKEIK